MRPTDADLREIPDDLLMRRPNRAGDGVRAKRLLAWLEERSWHPTGLQLDTESRQRRQARRQRTDEPAA